MGSAHDRDAVVVHHSHAVVGAAAELGSHAQLLDERQAELVGGRAGGQVESHLVLALVQTHVERLKRTV